MMQSCKRGSAGRFLSKRRSKSLDNVKFLNKCKLEGNDCNILGSIGSGNFVANPEEDAKDNEFPTSTCSWRERQRICELGFLADQLKCDDPDCGADLRLSNIVKETLYCYRSRLYIACVCGIVNAVETNKRHCVDNKGPKVFDINTKAALGVMMTMNAA